MSIIGRIQSFKYAFAGITSFVKSEPNVKIHLFMTLLVLIGGFYFEISSIEWILSILAIGMVLSAEAFNTAIEHLTDLVSPDYHELAGKTKDVAAGAVLIASIAAAIIGFLIFWPKILALF